MMKTNENVKKVVFEWEYGPDDVSLAVGSYYYGKGIYIQMISYSGPVSILWTKKVERLC